MGDANPYGHANLEYSHESWKLKKLEQFLTLKQKRKQVGKETK